MDKKEIDSNIHSIFSTPIYAAQLNRKFSTKELSFVNITKKDVFKNEGNITSNDAYILENKVFKNLKKEINLIVQDYFNKVMLSTKDITPCITQSWLNYTEKNQFHHQHSHPNSLVSGVLYIDSNKEFDKIKFFKKDIYGQGFKTKISGWNTWNSESWWCPVNTGDILLFPSSLKHMVECKEGDNIRISLAFNTFVKGTLGSYKHFTELKIQ